MITIQNYKVIHCIVTLASGLSVRRGNLAIVTGCDRIVTGVVTWRCMKPFPSNKALSLPYIIVYSELYSQHCKSTVKVQTWESTNHKEAPFVRQQKAGCRRHYSVPVPAQCPSPSLTAESTVPASPSTAPHRNTPQLATA